MKELAKKICDAQNLKSELKKIDLGIDICAKSLVDELRKIEGWEAMLQSCEEHYRRCPDEFFGWCKVCYGYNGQYAFVQFYKGYCGDCDEYLVLHINLNESLEEQVEKAKIRKEEQERILRREEEERERAELERLKAKYEND